MGVGWVGEGSQESGGAEDPAKEAAVQARPWFQRGHRCQAGNQRKTSELIAGPENTVRIEARVSFSSRGCSHAGLELYHWFPICQVMDVKLPKCLCPCQQQTNNGELLSGTASEKQEKLQWHRAGGSRFSYQTALPHTQKLFITPPTSPPPSSSQKLAGDRHALPLRALPSAILLPAHHSPESLWTQKILEWPLKVLEPTSMWPPQDICTCYSLCLEGSAQRCLIAVSSPPSIFTQMS